MLTALKSMFDGSERATSHGAPILTLFPCCFFTFVRETFKCMFG